MIDSFTVYSPGDFLNQFAPSSQTGLADLLQEGIAYKFAGVKLNAVHCEEFLFNGVVLVCLGQHGLVFAEAEAGVGLLAALCLNDEERAS